MCFNFALELSGGFQVGGSKDREFQDFLGQGSVHSGTSKYAQTRTVHKNIQRMAMGSTHGHCKDKCKSRETSGIGLMQKIHVGREGWLIVGRWWMVGWLSEWVGGLYERLYLRTNEYLGNAKRK